MATQISVIGQGYVGLPLALAICNAGYSTIGIDSSVFRISELQSSKSGIEDISDNEIATALASGKYKPTTDYSEVRNSNVILICVPTPLTKNNLPDLSAVANSAKELSKYLQKDSLVILESTVEPGTTRDFFVPMLEKSSGLSRDNFSVAFSPERIDPLNKNWNIKNTPKIVAGLTEKSKILAVDFYSKFIDTVVPVDSIEVAETAKLLENSFRLVNISFINEISIFCEKLGLEINDVVKAASTKPYGFMPFYPSIGAGGHCIPVDPIYLSNSANRLGVKSRFIDLATQVNNEMPEHVVRRAEEKLFGLKGKNILVVGVSYKSNVADVRETPVARLIEGLINKGANVSWHDDLVKEWNSEKSVTLSSDFDLAIIATPHDYLDLTKLGNVPILNTRGST
jgi:UDP-N-acetyl-D-glucosamine dehydrogenase